MLDKIVAAIKKIKNAAIKAPKRIFFMLPVGPSSDE